MLTLVPGVIAVGMLARRHAPRLGTAGLVLAVAAFMSLFWSNVTGADNVALGAARIGMHPGVTGALLTSIGNIRPVGLGMLIFVLGPSSAWYCSLSRSGAGAPSLPGRRCCSAPRRSFISFSRLSRRSARSTAWRGA